MPTHSAGSQQEGWGDGRWRGRAGSYRELTEYRSGLRGHGEEEAAAWPPLKEERRPGLPETAVRASRVPCPMSLSRFLLCPPCTHLIALNSVPTNSCLGPSQLVTLPGFLPTYFFIPSLLKTQCGSVSSQFLPLLSPLLPILPQSPSPAVPEKLL